MSEKSNNPETQRTTDTLLTVEDNPHAPILYFEAASNFGQNGGIVTVTLAASRYLIKENEVTGDAIAVAHLRCTPQAALSLRDALDKALLLVMPTEGQTS